jgi:mono/diheme cytochrome c family protein
MRIPRWVHAACVAVCVLASWPELSLASEDPAPVGRRIYEDGIDRDGVAVAARLVGAGWRLPPAAARCANCHGLGGEGGTEGLVRPPSLRWVRDDAAGRQALELALLHRRGRDGRTLHAAMPVFELDGPSLAALASHLSRLREPQAAQRPLLVGLLPRRSAMQAEELALESELSRCLGPVDVGPEDPVASDESGSMAWRLRFVRYETPDRAATLLRQLLLDSEVAFVVSPALGGWQKAFVDVVEAAAPHDRLPPILFPLTPEAEPLTSGAPVHWLFGGRHERSVALAQASQRQPGPADGSRRVAVPARSAPTTTHAPRQLGTAWGAASCAVVSRAVASAPPRQAGQPWAAWARAALGRLPRIDTADGLSLQASAPVAVQDWSVWEQAKDGRWTLLFPALPVATARQR